MARLILQKKNYSKLSVVKSFKVILYSYYSQHGLLDNLNMRE